MADDTVSTPKIGQNRGNAGKGRPKGASNKLTKTIREAVEISFDKIGGADWLARMADEQPVAYMTLLGKVLPQQVEHTGANGGAIQMEQVKNDAAAFASAVAGLASRSGTPSAN
jgi:hypothetical protein